MNAMENSNRLSLSPGLFFTTSLWSPFLWIMHTTENSNRLSLSPKVEIILSMRLLIIKEPENSCFFLSSLVKLECGSLGYIHSLCVKGTRLECCLLKAFVQDWLQYPDYTWHVQFQKLSSDIGRKECPWRGVWQWPPACRRVCVGSCVMNNHVMIM